MGTSAGSIMATYIAAGYSAKEMEDALKETDGDGIPVFKNLWPNLRRLPAKKLKVVLFAGYYKR
jgi:predicted acylesterase/phospholipase RssA